MHAVTIAARNYLPMARTLAKSFKANNPEHAVTIMVVDAEPGEIPPSADYELATPHDLALSADEFGRMSFLYDVTELSTALKPWALEMLLDRGADVAMYLDPDIYVYDSLDEIEKLSLANGIVLTPHTSQPMPRDGLRPTEADIMGAGTFNLGFIAVSKDDRDMLAWWQARLRRDSISAPEQMLFTDQRWIDLVPSYFGHHVLRDPGYNVAYWNLDHRQITDSGNGFLVNSEPLRFFHFSGYRPETPWILSKYVVDNPRVVLSEHPVVRALCDSYGQTVRDENLADAAAIPYRFNRFRNGTAITHPMRRIYRAAVLEADRNLASYPPAPSPADEDAAILAWFAEPVGPSGQINRLVHGLWTLRLDLSAAFPDVFGVHTNALLDWCRTVGVKDLQTVASLVPASAEIGTARSAVVERHDIRGVNVAGYFQAEMGVGQIGRLLVDAVRASGLPYSTLRSTQTVSRQEAAFDDTADPVRYRLNITSVNADQFAPWVADVGADILRNRYTIGVWAWEVEEFPAEYDRALELVDEVWAISSFVQKAIATRTTKPVHVIPHQISELPASVELDRESLGIGEQPYFLFMFDYLSIFDRKNPLGVIAAFLEAFPEPGEATLVIKAINGGRFRSQRERLRHAVGARKDIYIIEEYLARETVAALSANALAYVSLHRSEGLGLTLSESMSAGRPVIATNYSGNLDFMDERTSLLIDYELVDIPESARPYPTTARWAEPDISAAAKAMRWVLDNPDEANELGRRAQEHTRATGSLDRTVAFIDDRVNAIFDALELSDAPPASSEPAASAIARTRALLDTAPNVSSPSRLPAVAKKVRQLTYRALAHHDEHVNQRLYALTTALEAAEAQNNAVAADLNAKLANLGELATDHLDARLGSVEELVAPMADRTAAMAAQIGSLADQTDVLRVDSQGQTARIDHLSNAIDQVNLGLDISAERIDTLARIQPHVEATVRSHGAQFYDVSARLNEHSAQLARLDTEQSADPYRADDSALRVVDAQGHVQMGYDEVQGGVGGDYACFEDVYRGSEEFIAGRLQPYVDLVRAHTPVLDIGCGRGEFLGLLRAAEVPALGIDLDESMVRRSTELGLDVRLGDAVSFLEEAQESSFGAITSFQVVEHVAAEVLGELFRSSFRALQPGGVMIAETVNPHSPPALKTFWLDLTHVRPLFPESLLFLARECGFSSAKVVFPHVEGDLGTQRRHSGEYAIVAYK